MSHFINSKAWNWNPNPNCCWCQVVGRELRGHMTAMKKIAVGEWMPAGFVKAKKVATGEIRWLFIVNLCETMWNYCTLNWINLIYPPLKLTGSSLKNGAFQGSESPPFQGSKLFLQASHGWPTPKLHSQLLGSRRVWISACWIRNPKVGFFS